MGALLVSIHACRPTEAVNEESLELAV
jgi:hypothetical protein